MIALKTERGSAMQRFFADFWNFQVKYIQGYENRNPDTYWESIVKESSLLAKKYSDTELDSYPRALLLTFMVMMEEKDKEDKK